MTIYQQLYEYRLSLQEMSKDLRSDGEYVKNELILFLCSFVPCETNDKQNLHLSSDRILEILKPCIELEKNFISDTMLAVGYNYSLRGGWEVGWDIKPLTAAIDLSKRADHKYANKNNG